MARPWPPPRATTVGPPGGGPPSAQGSPLAGGVSGRRPPVGRRMRVGAGAGAGRLEKSLSSATFEVPVMDPGGKAQALEGPGQLLGQHHAAVVAPGAADADRQVRLAFLHV